MSDTIRLIGGDLEMAHDTEKIVSIIGDSYVDPIVTLSERLFSNKLSQNEVLASQYENGYSISLCILTAVWFESWTMRVRYLNGKSPHATTKHPVEFINKLYSDFPLYDEMMEVFVLRDTLVHNHLWNIEFLWEGMKLQDAAKDAFSGDNKYLQHVDLSARLTKKLRLNVVPTKVCNLDFKAELKTVVEALLFIKNKDPDHFGFGNSSVRFRGKFISIREFVKEVENQ